MTNTPYTAGTTQGFTGEVSPDSLMNDFRGRPIIGILAFTVVVHVVLIGTFSMGYLKNELLGEDSSTMSKEERLDVAVREATTSLREIAERHDVTPQELSDRFASGKSRPTLPAGESQPATPETTDAPAESDEPKSAIEKTLNKTETGPDVPELAPEEEEDDLFR